jgi:hypothetical protein
VFVKIVTESEIYHIYKPILLTIKIASPQRICDKQLIFFYSIIHQNWT